MLCRTRFRRKKLVTIIITLSYFYFLLTHVKRPAIRYVSYSVNSDELKYHERVQLRPSTALDVKQDVGSALPYEVSDDLDSLETDNPFYSRNTSSYINLLNVKPPNYLENFKSPCWREAVPLQYPYEDNLLSHLKRFRQTFKELKEQWYLNEAKRTHSRVRCLPYFYITGFPKCGTSDLYRKISKHPDVAYAPIKETHWWAFERVRLFIQNQIQYVPISMYTDLFDKTAKKIEETTDDIHEAHISSGTNIHSLIFGDASPTTGWCMGYWNTLPENVKTDVPSFFTAHYIHHITPQAKIIFIVRNPVDRLYSSYQYFHPKSYACSLEEFHQYVIQSIAVWNACRKTAVSDWICLFNRTVIEDMLLNDIRAGFYVTYIHIWLKVFPREQVHILRLEDYSSDKLNTLASVYDFLQLTPVGSTHMNHIINTPTDNSGNESTKTKMGPMMTETKKILEAFYAPYNKALAEQLGDPKFSYNEVH